MNSHTTPSFWQACDNLPTESQKQADEKFDLWKKNPHHPSLRYKCVKPEKQFWSARKTQNYRTLGVRSDDTMIWFWIGNHDDYERLLR